MNVFMVGNSYRNDKTSRFEVNLITVSVGMLAFIGILATLEQIFMIQLLFESVRYIGIGAMILLILIACYEVIQRILKIIS